MRCGPYTNISDAIKVSHSAPRKLARERGRLVREQLFTELGV